MTNESNFIATLRYPGSRNYYLTRDSSGFACAWRRNWSDRFGGLFEAFAFNDADALLEKARAVPFEPGGTMLVKTIYEARSDEKDLHFEVHESVGFNLVNRRINRKDQDEILRECEPLGTFLMGLDKEAEWASALVEHPRLKEINANRYDINIWLMHRKMNG